MSHFKVAAAYNGRRKLVEIPRANLSLYALECALANAIASTGVSVKYESQTGVEQNLRQDFHLDAALKDSEERGAANLELTVVSTSSPPVASSASPAADSPYRPAGPLRLAQSSSDSAAASPSPSSSRSGPAASPAPAADVRLPSAKKSAPVTRSSHTSSPVLSAPTTMGRLAASLVDGSTAPLSPPVKAKFCSSCGTAASGGKFCMECGAALGGSPAASPVSSPAQHPSVLSPEKESSKPTVTDSIAKKLAAEERKKKRFSAPYPKGNRSSTKNACGACGNHLGLSSVSALGKSWHKECFCCQFCHKSLLSSGFKAHEEQPSCPECFNERFGPKCFGCEKTISSQYVEIHDKMFHMECFVCSRCTASLQNGCTLTSEGYICRGCA